MEHYLVISSDCHAGLETPAYKSYVDARYRDAFDQSLVEREALLEQMREERGGLLKGGDDEFQEEWFGHEEGEESLHVGGLRCGWDAARRDKELDNDGVAGEVIFPGPDAATGSMGAPFGAGLVIGAELDPELLLAGARAYNRWCAELCSGQPERRKRPRDRRRSWATSTARSPRSAGAHDSGLHGGILIPAQWGDVPVVHARRLRPGVGRLRGIADAGALHSGPGAHQDYGTATRTSGCTSRRRAGGRRGRCGSCCCAGVFERFPDLKFAVTEAGSFWAADLLWTLDRSYSRDHGARKTADTGSATSRCGRATTSTATARSGRRTPAGASSARRYEIGVDNIMWGNDFPHPEGTWPYTREFLKNRFWDMPRRRDRADPRPQRTSTSTTSTATASARSPIASARRPDDLGQTDAAELAKWDELREVGPPVAHRQGSRRRRHALNRDRQPRRQFPTKGEPR